MCAAECSSAIDHARRRLLRIVATGIAVASTANLLPRRLADAPKADLVRPFKINIPEDQLVDLRRRIAATRWPDQETAADDSQGLRLATKQQLAPCCGTDYDWRKCEARLNALSQFMTKIDELDIHFLHVHSVHEQALPLIVARGWPGSIIEHLKIIGPLTNPTAHGAAASDAFHLVIPSIPGYGFSERPTTTGWGPDRVARAWIVMMKRLVYTQFVAQGGDLSRLNVTSAGGGTRSRTQLGREELRLFPGSEGGSI